MTDINLFVEKVLEWGALGAVCAWLMWRDWQMQQQFAIKEANWGKIVENNTAAVVQLTGLLHDELDELESIEKEVAKK